MSEYWQPIPILILKKNAEVHDNSTNLREELKQLLGISKKLFNILLAWKDLRLEIKNIEHVCKIINKLMNSSRLLKKIESVCIKNSYWADLIQHLEMEDTDMNQPTINCKESTVSFEMMVVDALNQLISQNSSNAVLVKEAIELSFNIVQIYLSNTEVSNKVIEE